MLILWRGIEFYLSNNVHGDFGVSGWISTGWCLEVLVQVYTDSVSNWVMWARNVMFFSIAFCDVSPQKPALLAQKFANMLLKITCFHSRWDKIQLSTSAGHRIHLANVRCCSRRGISKVGCNSAGRKVDHKQPFGSQNWQRQSSHSYSHLQTANPSLIQNPYW